MTITLPDWERAQTPVDIERAAKELQEVDAPQAIEPLACLNRRAPGWLVIQLSLIVTLLVTFVGWGITLGMAAGGVWLIFTTLHQLLRFFYPEWAAVWWIGWTGFVVLWLWGDERLRGLLQDGRFALPRDVFTLSGVIMLWPCRMLAGAMRLCVALSFLTLTLVLPLTALLVIVQAWSLWRAGEMSAVQAELLTYGFAAGGLYLLFGLFVFSDWPREATMARSVSTRRKLLRVFWAALMAAGLGLLVRTLSPVNQDLTGLAAGVILFIVILRFINARSANSPVDFAWVKQVKGVTLTARQKRFLRLTLFMLGTLGMGVVVMTVVGRWNEVRLLLPLPWLIQVSEWYRASVDERLAGYEALAPWTNGFVIAGIACLLALVYLSGWGIRLARPFAWPFFWLRKAVEDLLVRLRARLAVGAAIRHHRARNRRLAGKHGNQAVCREHLARFKAQQAQLSYRRKWRYWWCPECRSDAQAIQGIRRIRGVFDQNMTDPLWSEAGVLHVNLLHCADKRLPLPRDLQEIHVDYVADPYEIEAFTVAYQDFAARNKAIYLKRIRLKIEPTANLEESTARLLKRTFQE